jgi:hypothetical protein
MEIQLLPHQTNHVAFIRDLYENKKEKLYIDCSVMGAGKTYIAMYLAKLYNLDLFVICPKSVIHTWTEGAALYDIGVGYVGTYASMRTKSNEWLTKTFEVVTVGNNKQANKAIYTPTDAFHDMVKKGILLVIDEFQNLKNDSEQTSACASLSRALIHGKQQKQQGAFAKMIDPDNHHHPTNNRSRIGLLSATPFDKKEHALNVYRVSGLMTSDTFFKSNFGRNFELVGLADIVSKCNEIDPVKTKYRAYISNKASAIAASYILFVDIFRPYYVSIMPEPKINTALDCKNVFCNLPDKTSEEKMEKAIRELADACRFDSKTNKIRNPAPGEAMNMGEIGGKMMAIEFIKVENIVVRKVREELERAPNTKVVVFVNFYATAEYIMGAFLEYKPLFLNGSQSINERSRIVSAFQETNTNHRLFIANTQVGGVGIDLDDRDGKFPRRMFILPTFHILNMHQATGRIRRASSKSDAYVRMIYTKMGEVQVINAIARKTEVLSTVAINESSSVKFPGDYEVETEA